MSPLAESRARRIVVTARDVEVLLSLFKYRYLTLSQLERLHFVSAQTAARRLRLLAGAGYVSLFRSPAVTDRVVLLARGGLRLVAERLAIPPAGLERSRARFQPKDHLFLRHALAIADFRIALTTACARREDVHFLGFLADHVVERTDRGRISRFTRDCAADITRRGDQVAHTPDGVFALECGGVSALGFLEIDRGTETVSDRERGVAKILRFYLNYLAGGGFSRYQEVFGVTGPFAAVRVLIATTSKRRIESIRSVGASLGFEPRRALQFIWLTEIGSVNEHSVFDQIWVPLDPAVNGRFGILPKRDPSSSDTRERAGS